MFTLQSATPATLTSVDDSLTFDSSDLPEDWVSAASEAHLFVQTAAKGLAQQNGLNIGDPALYKSQGWFDALVSAIAKYADFVEIVGAKDVQVNNSTHSGSINISAIMGSIMSFYLGPTAAAEWSTLNDLLGNASDPKVSDFMNFWWSHVAKSTTDTGMSIGPNVRTEDNQIQFAVCFYSMTHVIDDWRSLFVSSTYEEFDVSAGGLTLTMDYDNYVKYARPAVQDYLGLDIANKIHHAPVPKATFLGGSRGSHILSAPHPVLDGTLAVTRTAHGVNVVDPHGDSMLGGNGIGDVTLDGPTLKGLRCGVFTKPRPVVGNSYVVTGTYDDTTLPFKYTVKCTQTGQQSSFAP
ncbi:hypothetical protein AB0F52_09725 [Amycolatopsis sp. NPDC024027]|uniref:hypothetical protein n=1 Tax=Amycolatopsis sp. NPDC024027 TaxID=3154327 RepID=UPI0033F01C7C